MVKICTFIVNNQQANQSLIQTRHIYICFIAVYDHFVEFCRGVADVLKKRLKSYYRQKKLTKAHVSPPKKNKIEFLMVIDFEATCEENNDRYKHEIIEFPVILVNLENNK